jgi:two-component system chemotaxis sensor kinase CheA
LEGLDDLRTLFTTVHAAGNDHAISIDDKVSKYDIKNLISPAAEVSLESDVNDSGESLSEQKAVKKDDDKMTVAMSLLNDFMEESGELTVIRNSILKTVKKIETKYRGDSDIELLNELLDGMYDVTSNIQGRITEMRNVPLQNTFRPFKRLIRDLSKQLGKDVNLQLSGEDLAVDNVIAKLFNNTLIHIIRNSLDHGLETSEKRKEIGKDPTGLLEISVSEIGEDIVLKIRDDGNGINAEVIKKLAVEKGLFTVQDLAEMSELEIMNIIFASGFSTAEVVSDLSGRGVGMDMVRGSFEEMGGSVFVRSEHGKGSTFTLTVPIPKSVLIINTLSVKVSNENYIFHMDEVSEVIRYEKETENSKLYSIDNQLVLNHNDKTIQLIHLADVLNLDKIVNKSQIFNVVVLRIGTTRIGIIVDEIHEFEEVVSRQISGNIHCHDLYHGASLVGSGEVALILSASGIASRQHISVATDSSSDVLSSISEDDNIDVKRADEYMLFKYDSENFLCLDLDDVERLEKIEKTRIESVGNNFIIRYRDQVLPIIEPAHLLGLNDTSLKNIILDKTEELLEIIVVNIQNKKVGILVHQLDEIQSTFEEIHTGASNNPGIKGSVYINNSTICVMDLEFLLEKYKGTKLQINVKDEQLIAA